jgi:hypothetical protein
MEIFQDLGSRPILFIRFNPDSYLSGGNEKIKSCFSYDKAGFCHISDSDMFEKRLQCLLKTVQFHLSNIPSKDVTIESLFYDNY